MFEVGERGGHVREERHAVKQMCYHFNFLTEVSQRFLPLIVASPTRACLIYACKRYAMDWDG